MRFCLFKPAQPAHSWMSGSGCGMDQNHVWSSSKCGTNQFMAVAGATRYQVGFWICRHHTHILWDTVVSSLGKESCSTQFYPSWIFCALLLSRQNWLPDALWQMSLGSLFLPQYAEAICRNPVTITHAKRQQATGSALLQRKKPSLYTFLVETSSSESFKVTASKVFFTESCRCIVVKGMQASSYLTCRANLASFERSGALGLHTVLCWCPYPEDWLQPRRPRHPQLAVWAASWPANWQIVLSWACVLWQVRMLGESCGCSVNIVQYTNYMRVYTFVRFCQHYLAILHAMVCWVVECLQYQLCCTALLQLVSLLLVQVLWLHSSCDDIWGDQERVTMIHWDSRICWMACSNASSSLFRRNTENPGGLMNWVVVSGRFKIRWAAGYCQAWFHATIDNMKTWWDWRLRLWCLLA